LQVASRPFTAVSPSTLGEAGQHRPGRGDRVAAADRLSSATVVVAAVLLLLRSARKQSSTAASGLGRLSTARNATPWAADIAKQTGTGLLQYRTLTDRS